MTDKSVNLAEIPTWECHQLLEGREIGRICVIDHGYPVAVPISYRILGLGASPYIVIRTAPDTMVARHRGFATLEVDHILEAEHTAWSILVRGTLQKIDGPHDLPDPQPWVTENRHQWMTLDVTAITGRRFVPSKHHDGFSVEWQFG